MASPRPVRVLGALACLFVVAECYNIGPAEVRRSSLRSTGAGVLRIRGGENSARALILLTSNEAMGSTDKKTGLWLDEFAAPYYRMKDAGFEVVLANPKGGATPVDAGSLAEAFQTEDTKRYDADEEAKKALANCVPLEKVDIDSFDGLFIPGGHGLYWDLVDDKTSINFIEKTFAAGKPVAAVCHGPCALKHCKAPGGEPLLKGQACTGFTNTEEAAVGLTEVVPFLLEDQMKALGGNFKRQDDWHSCVVKKGNLITGQNPQSAPACGEAFVNLVKRGKGLDAPEVPDDE